MKVLLDGMGGDLAPGEIVKGAAETSSIIDHEIVIFGDGDRIESELKQYSYDSDKITVRHCSQIIDGEDSPVKSIKVKTDSSIVRCLEALRSGEGDAFLSAGNSGAIMSGGSLIVGRIPGIDRPAIGSTYPILNSGGVALLIDAGANAECKPGNMLQFAIMGSIYCENVLGIDSPKVGLVNMGTEPGKGGALEKEAFHLLEDSGSRIGLNFIGNVEARDIPIGACDVIVCNGFVGNVILKMTEGVGLSIMHEVKEKLTSGMVAKAASLLLINKLGELKKLFDYTEYGGAPLLGLAAPVVKMHGSSNAKAVRNGISRVISYAQQGVIGTIAEKVAQIEPVFPAEHVLHTGPGEDEMPIEGDKTE